MVEGAYEDGVGVGGGVEPAGLNSTAEPLTPAIHQCRGVTGQEQGYAECVMGKETEGL